MQRFVRLPIPAVALLAATALLAAYPAPLTAGDRDLTAPKSATDVVEGKKVALVVGNGAYQQVGKLTQAPKDARLVADTLTSLGFTVVSGYDMDRSALSRAAVDFEAQLSGAAVGFFYYAGHGVAVDGHNYLVPVDARITDEKYVSSEAVDVAKILQSMEAAHSRLNVVVLDACRNNPFAGQWSAGGRSIGAGGLAGVDVAPRGSVIAYATAQGRVAADEGVYARSLATHLKEPGTEITDVFRLVYAEVEAASHNGQSPWYTESRNPGRFYPAGAPIVLAPSSSQTVVTPVTKPTSPTVAPPSSVVAKPAAVAPTQVTSSKSAAAAPVVAAKQPSAVVASSYSSANQHAAGCEEVMNMLDVNVPEVIVVQTVHDGLTIDGNTAACLSSRGAPSAVIAAVRERVGGTMASAAVATPSASNDAPWGSASSSAPTTTGPDPKQLAEAIEFFNANNPLSASLELYQYLQTAPSNYEPKALYYMGRALYDLKLWNSAQHYFIEGVKKGSADPYFKYALSKVVSLTRTTGDSSDLSRIVPRIPLADFPKTEVNEYSFHFGLRLRDQDKLTDAQEWLASISERSALYPRARYVQGTIFVEQGNLKSAAKAFREVAGESIAYEDGPVPATTRDLAVLGLGRIYYSLEQYSEARRWYELLGRDSSQFAQAQLEAAWTDFIQARYSNALDRLATIQKVPKGKVSTVWLPEAGILEALVHFNLCDYDSTDRLTSTFSTSTEPIYAELKAALAKYGTEDGKTKADEVFRAYLGPNPQSTTLPSALIGKFLRNRELAGLKQHIDMLDGERSVIDSQKSQWTSGPGVELKRILEEDRLRLQKRAGLIFLTELALEAKTLGDLRTQAEIIRFEVVEARRSSREPSVEDAKAAAKGEMGLCR